MAKPIQGNAAYDFGWLADDGGRLGVVVDDDFRNQVEPASLQAAGSNDTAAQGLGAGARAGREKP